MSMLNFELFDGHPASYRHGLCYRLLGFMLRLLPSVYFN